SEHQPGRVAHPLVGIERGGVRGGGLEIALARGHGLLLDEWRRADGVAAEDAAVGDVPRMALGEQAFAEVAGAEDEGSEAGAFADGGVEPDAGGADPEEGP